MTAFDRLDPIDARFAGGIEDLAAASRPDYLDDVFQVTARSRQRPSWTFLERWLPMDTTMPVSTGRFRVPVLALVALLLLAVLAALLAVYAGSRLRGAPPYGVANNGVIAYGIDDIWVRDTLTGTPRMLISGPGQQQGGWFSPDGKLVAYDNLVEDERALWVADADGSHQRWLYDADEDGGWFAWSGDSRHLSLVAGLPTAHLYILSTDGTPMRTVDLGGLRPDRTAVWDPQVPGQLLLRAVSPDGKVGLYYVRDDGTGLRPLPLPWDPAVGDTFWDFSNQVLTDDGEHIALNVGVPMPGLDPAFRYRVGLMDRDGSNARLLPGPDDPTIHEAWPTFSPDGKWLVAQRFTFGSKAGDGTVGLALMAADGSGVAREVIPMFSTSDQGIDVTWSPDGTSLIAWLRGPRAAVQIDLATGRQTPLIGVLDAPGWQRSP